MEQRDEEDSGVKATRMTTLPTKWPFPKEPPKPLTKKQQQDQMLKEADKALF
jgi:hypothetical protein